MLKDAVKSIFYAVPVLTAAYLLFTGAPLMDYVAAAMWFVSPLLVMPVKG